MASNSEIAQNALVERIAAYVKGPKSRLLKHLFQHRELGLTGVAIETAWREQKLSKTELQGGNRRKLLTELRQKVEDYYRTYEGVDELLRLVIPNNRAAKDYEPYTLQFILNNGASSFWRTHLKKPRDNALILTVPVFFRDSIKRNLYVRHFEVNSGDAEGVTLLGSKVPGLRELPLEGVHHYVSLAEMNGMLETVKFLEGYRLDVNSPVTEHMIAGDERREGRHVISFGTSRANAEVDAIQRTYHLGYSIEEDRLLIRDSTNEERSDLVMSEIHFTESNRGIEVPDDLNGRNVYAVVTRGIASNGLSSTAVASNHGAATRAVCELLTDEESVKTLTQAMRLDEDWQGFPLRFQILFRVSLDSEENTPTQTSYVAWRREENGGPA